MSEQKTFPIQSHRGAKPHPLKIPWDLAELAYSVYSAQYGRGQSLERLAERGGFGPGEMDEFVPDWRERCSEREMLVARVRDLEAAQYVPGEWKCDACDFVVSKNVMHMANGVIAPQMADCVEACPNDGTLLRRVRWDEACREARDEAVKIGIENQKIRRGLIDKLDPLDHCKGLVEYCESNGIPLHEKTREGPEGTNAAVFCAIGPAAAGLVAVVREWAGENNLKTGK